MNIDGRHLVHAKYRIVIEVALFDSTLLKRDCTRERRCKAVANARLHLHGNNVRIDRKSAIDRADDFVQLQPLRGAFELCDLCDD